MHEIDVDMVGLEPVEGLVELLGDDVGIDERRMRALADQHEIVARPRGRLPLAEQPSVLPSP